MFSLNGGNEKLHQETVHLVKFTAYNYEKIIYVT